MNIQFIIPQDDGINQSQANARLFPPAGLAKMAGVAGCQAQINVIDERLNSAKRQHRATIAVIFITAYNQQRALRLSKLYRALGSFVVLSGKILESIQSNIDLRGQCLFIGNNPFIMAEFLADFSLGKTRPIYRD